MRKDWFKTRSDRKFLHNFFSVFMEYHVLAKDRYRLDEEMKKRFSELEKKIRVDRFIMTELANEYIGLSLGHKNWPVLGNSIHGDSQDSYFRWLTETIEANQAAVIRSEITSVPTFGLEAA